jgi:hypothetical protein
MNTVSQSERFTNWLSPSGMPASSRKEVKALRGRW